MQTGVLLITGNISRFKETAVGGIIDQRILSYLLNSFQKAVSCKKNTCKKVFILHFVQFVLNLLTVKVSLISCQSFTFYPYCLGTLSGLCHPGVTQADLIGIFLIPKLYYIRTMSETFWSRINRYLFLCKNFEDLLHSCTIWRRA